jgi:hydrogenase expression/formation protein HypC
MKIATIDGTHAQVEQEGVARTIRIDFVPGVQPGEYVLVHAGIAIERVDAEEAAETLNLIQEIVDALHR